MRLGPQLTQEFEAAIHCPRRLQLVAQHWGERQRHRRSAEHVEQGQIRSGDRLPQPLLAEWPGAEALDIRHMRVEDDGQRAGSLHRPQAKRVWGCATVPVLERRHSASAKR